MNNTINKERKRKKNPWSDHDIKKKLYVKKNKTVIQERKKRKEIKRKKMKGKHKKRTGK